MFDKGLLITEMQSNAILSAILTKTDWSSQIVNYYLNVSLSHFFTLEINYGEFEQAISTSEQIYCFSNPQLTLHKFLNSFYWVKKMLSSALSEFLNRTIEYNRFVQTQFSELKLKQLKGEKLWQTYNYCQLVFRCVQDMQYSVLHEYWEEQN